MIEPLESFANKDILVATLYSGANVKISAVALPHPSNFEACYLNLNTKG